MEGMEGRGGEGRGAHIEAGLVHQQLGVHQVHLHLMGTILQEADDDGGGQAVPRVLQGQSWGPREAAVRPLCVEQQGSGQHIAGPELWVTAPH